MGPKNHVLDGVDIHSREWAILWVIRDTKKHCESLLRCTLQTDHSFLNKRLNSGTAAADCNAPDWMTSHCIASVKLRPITMRPVVKIL